MQNDHGFYENLGYFVEHLDAATGKLLFTTRHEQKPEWCTKIGVVGHRMVQLDSKVRTSKGILNVGHLTKEICYPLCGRKIQP